jgi:putative ABC transport system ATP-binding protein
MLGGPSGRYRFPVRDNARTAAAVVGASSNDAVVQLVGVTKTYGSGDTQVVALGGIDLRIADGEFIAIMGPSGSGKSTCMNILGCLDTPTAGSYRFRGVEVTTLSRNQRALLRRYYLGFVFQGYNLLNRTTALENVEIPLIYRGLKPADRRDRAREALAAVGLGSREHHTPSELSGGQQQRVAIARAIVSEPSLLLADEPTGNLDSKMDRDIMELLGSLNQTRGITIAMVTHEPDMAAYTARQVRFYDGFLVADERRPAGAGVQEALR